MGNRKELGSIQTLIAERQETHGDAFKWTDAIIGLLWRGKVLEPLILNNMIFKWAMVLNKLMRAMFSPWVEEHWRDIQGWAELALTQIKEQNRE